MLAYLDCFSGISGDMSLGAMVHLGVPVDWLKHEIARLPLDGFDITAQKVAANGIAATHIDVLVEESHHYRHYGHIRDLIGGSPLPEAVKTRSLAIFDRIATAEAAIHDVAKEKVHFHEVGSMDTIVDVVGTCLSVSYLNIDTLAASPLTLGSGFVTCQHGVLPVPAPATLEILKGVPVLQCREAQELVTPTGAAIAAELAGGFGPMPGMKIEGIGYGAGTRKLKSRPNVLRVLLGQSVESAGDPAFEKLVMVECCIDDMNPELFGYLMERLFSAGALDVCWVPVYMKKNRPGTMIQALCEAWDRDALAGIIFQESTSLGVRFHDVYRQALEREAGTVQTELGEVTVKRVTGQDGRVRIIPEYEACKAIAQDRKVSLRTVYETVLRATGSK